MLVGDSGTGKSSLINRFAEDTFSDEFSSTIGVDYKVKQVIVMDEKVKMQIWDTAGQERFLSITSQYFRNSDGLVIVFDVTNRNSFNNLQYWLDEAQNNCDPKTLKFIVGNKIDNEIRMVSYGEGEAKADMIGCKYFETSSKTGQNVEGFCLESGKLIMESRSIREEEEQSSVVEHHENQSNGYCSYC